MKLLFVNNHDSFVYNIVQIAGKLGYGMDIMMNDDLSGVDPDKYDRIIISPGPGNPVNPRDSGQIPDFLERCGDVRVLGICFGHQAMAYFLNSGIRVMERPLHGEVDTIIHSHSLLYGDIPEKFRAVRYHSLTVVPSENIVVDAVSERDGSVMGFHDRKNLYFGIQYHPESYYTEYGENLIRNFVEAE
ncbi:MAG: aminodeoxychorismate/anthranilate synthase component II [Candidatus Thermoplasmatota archaeon]|nr:aminodeoxychorismate/anthranilate synthase component II [Candidatus Thermoplasmatota archaeon]MCL5791342.1 aminodeoxychorismate/anthranilate synthase component II [Candidatus Thermoplasmatota archaeon]